MKQKTKKTTKQQLRVKNKLERFNASLSVPLIPGEIVNVIKEEKDPNYLTIEHNSGQTISIFHKTHFEEVIV